MSKKKKHDKDEEPKKEKKNTGKPEKAAAPKKRKPVESALSSGDIALRAYYIAEHRQKHGLTGDEAGDWHEAERQLRKEARKAGRK